MAHVNKSMFFDSDDESGVEEVDDESGVNRYGLIQVGSNYEEDNREFKVDEEEYVSSQQDTTTLLVKKFEKRIDGRPLTPELRNHYLTIFKAYSEVRRFKSNGSGSLSLFDGDNDLELHDSSSTTLDLQRLLMQAVDVVTGIVQYRQIRVLRKDARGIEYYTKCLDELKSVTFGDNLCFVKPRFYGIPFFPFPSSCIEVKDQRIVESLKRRWKLNPNDQVVLSHDDDDELDAYIEFEKKYTKLTVKADGIDDQVFADNVIIPACYVNIENFLERISRWIASRFYGLEIPFLCAQGVVKEEENNDELIMTITPTMVKCIVTKNYQNNQPKVVKEYHIDTLKWGSILDQIYTLDESLLTELVSINRYEEWIQYGKNLHQVTMNGVKCDLGNVRNPNVITFAEAFEHIDDVNLSRFGKHDPPVIEIELNMFNNENEF